MAEDLSFMQHRQSGIPFLFLSEIVLPQTPFMLNLKLFFFHRRLISSRRLSGIMNWIRVGHPMNV